MEYVEAGIVYQFSQTKNVIGLSQIVVPHERKVVVNFTPAFQLENQSGSFSICPPEEMGFIGGSYQVKRIGERVDLSLIPDIGLESVLNSLISKIILSSKTVFATWSKAYRYTASIDLKTMEIDAKWVNGNLEN